MRVVLVVIFSILFFSTCRKAKTCEEPRLDCQAIQCIAYWSYFDFRLIDRVSGEDLVFSTNPRYSNNDIKLFADAARTVPIQYTIDHSGKILQTIHAKGEMYLEIKGTDIYKLTADFKAKDCCSNEVKNLWLDGQMVCSCCSGAVYLSIK